MHPYQPILGTHPGPGSNTGLSSEITDSSGPGPTPTAIQTSTDAGTGGPQTCHRENLDRDGEEEREAQARAEEIYMAMEGDLQPQTTAPQELEWQPATVNLSPRLRSHWETGPRGEINEVPWDQDASFRKYHSHPPIDDMLRAQIIPPGGLTIQVMPPKTWRDPFHPHGLELCPQPEEELCEGKEERDLIETKEDPSEDDESRTPDPNDRSTPSPPGSTYLHLNITDTGPNPFRRLQRTRGWDTTRPSKQQHRGKSQLRPK